MKYIRLIIIVLLFILTSCTDKDSDKTGLKKQKKESIITTDKLSFICVGDAVIHNGIYIDANTHIKDSNGYYIYDFHKMFNYIKDIISPYDLKFYNQETIIGGKNLGLSNYPRFNSPDEIGNDLVDIGFNIVNLATNHTMDKGIKGAFYSANFWHSKDNVLSIGSYTSLEQRNSIEIREKNNISYAALSYTYGTNGLNVDEKYSYLVNVWPTNENEFEEYKIQVKKDIESVRSKVDLLMVIMHWGDEYSHTINEYQSNVSEYLSSLGVDVIIGSHPHVIQKIEYVNNTLVIYSLGNFISAQDKIDNRVGMVVSFEVEKTLKDKIKTKLEIKNIKADLLWTNYTNYTNFSVIPFSKLTDNELNNSQQIYDEYTKYINPTNDSRIKIGL